jgi:hypothetical protein
MTASVPFSAPPTPPLTGLSMATIPPRGKQIVNLDRGPSTDGGEVDEAPDTRAVGNVRRDITGRLKRRQTGHHGFGALGDFFDRRGGLRSDEPAHHLGTGVERDDIMPGLDQPAHDRKTHVAQADKPDIHH